MCARALAVRVQSCLFFTPGLYCFSLNCFGWHQPCLHSLAGSKAADAVEQHVCKLLFAFIEPKKERDFMLLGLDSFEVVKNQ